ncbi:MAG: GNAT family N-acetyltransferase [Propionibacteriaceae bacterium]|nr:GNAT family N-acetyltransferase [Propionibacteriaceae bacterium]
MQVEIDFRDVIEADLPGLDWTGGPAHQLYVATTLDATYAGDVELVVGEAGGWRLVAFGGVDFRTWTDAGRLWMLIVDDAWRNLGVGTALIGALEDRVRARGLTRARLHVEHDNPQARQLYEQLGYRAIGEQTDSWPNDAGGTTTVAVTLMEHALS